MWILFGLLWGVIALTNTAVVSMLPFCLLWLLYRLPRRPQQFVGAALCVLTAALVVSPWLVRNYQVFGKFIFVRDNLPLEMYEANNDQSTGLWTRNEHPGNNPEAMRRFQELGELGFMDEKQQEVRQFIREHPGRFLWFTVERAVYFWIAPPQAAIVAGYDLMISRHTNFLLGAVFAFAGLWLTIRNRKRGAFLLACFLAHLSTSVLPGDALPSLQTSDRARDDHAGRLSVLGGQQDPDPLADLQNVSVMPRIGEFLPFNLN